MLCVCLMLASLSSWYTHLKPYNSYFDQWVNTAAIWNTLPFFICGILIAELTFPLNRFFCTFALFIFISFSTIEGQFIPLAVVGISSFFYLLMYGRIYCRKVLVKMGQQTYAMYFLHWYFLINLTDLFPIPSTNVILSLLIFSQVLAVSYLSYLGSIFVSIAYDIPLKNILRKYLKSDKK